MPAVHFADKLRETGMPSFMKVDIEGSDMLCLQALLEFEQRPQSLSIESHKTDWSRIQQEFALLDRLGYDRFAVVQQGDIPGKSVQTRKLDGAPLTFCFEEDSSGPFGSDVGPWLEPRGGDRPVQARVRRLPADRRQIAAAPDAGRSQAARVGAAPLQAAAAGVV